MHSEFLIHGLLPKDSLVLLVGPPKSGKTDLAAAMARAISTGRPFADRPTKRGAVLWVSYEEPVLPLKLPSKTPLYFTASLPEIDSEETKQRIMEAVLRVKPALVVIDSLYGACQRNLRKRNNALRQLVDLKNAMPCTLLVLHHTLKRDPRPSEARQVLLAADGVIRASLAPGSFGQAGGMALHLSGDALPPQTIWLQTPAPGHYRNATRFVKVGRLDTARHRILSHLQRASMTTAQLQESTQLNPNTLRNTLQILRASGRIYRGRGRKWALQRIELGSNVPT